MVPRGISLTLANQVGNLLGAARVRDARRTAVVGVAASFIATGLYCAGIYVSGTLVAHQFTQDPRVLSEARLMWPWFCGLLLTNGPFGVISGLNRGLGLQRENAACVLLLLWPVGAPLVVYGSHTIVQVWQHLALVYALLTASMGACAMWANWTLLADKIRQTSTATT